MFSNCTLTLASITKKKKDILSEIELNVHGVDPRDLYGQNNKYIKALKDAFPEVTINSRGDFIKLKGKKKDTQKVKAKLELMMRILREQEELSMQAVTDLIGGGARMNFQLNAGSDAVIVKSRTGKPIVARTENQKRLVEATQKNDVVFGVGPAGTGKTYTAVALAVRALKEKRVHKIILTRPAVEAGESLGFLPGDLQEKVDPYLRPLYDALNDMIPFDKLAQFMQDRTIEVAPLAFMRGRTLDNAYIILDEAQNCTTTQLKMFLTRLGPSAKCIITGDLSQIDLPRSQRSGLYGALDLLPNLRGISVVRFNADDVVRHRLVREIILAYEAEAARRKSQREEE